MNRILKISLIGFLCLLLGAAAMLAGASFYIETEHARQVLQQQINRVIPGSISWEDARFSLVKGRVVLHRVRLLGVDGEEVVFLDQLLLEINWMPLLKREAMIERLIIERPILNLSDDSNGSLNLIRALVHDDGPTDTVAEERPDRDGEALPVNIVLRALLLTEGKLQLLLENDAIDFNLANLNLEAAGNLGQKSGRLSIQASGVQFSRDKVKTALDRIHLDIGLKNGRVDPLSLNMGNEMAKIELSGTADRIWSQPAVDLTTDLTASLSFLKNLLSLQPAMTGTLSSRIHLKGAIDDPRLNATFDYGGGILFDQAIDGAHLGLVFNGHAFVLDRTEVGLAGGHVGLAGKLDLGRSLAQIVESGDLGLESAAYRLHLKGERLNMEQLFGDSGEWRGPVRGTVTLDGQGLSLEEASAAMVAEISGSGVSGKWIERPINPLAKTSVRIDAGVLTLQALEASTGPVTLSASGRLDLATQALQARLTLDAHELDKLAASPQLAELSGRIHLEGSVDGTVSAPVFQIDVKGQKFRYQNLTIGDMVLTAGLDRSGVLEVATIDLKNQGSTIRGNGSVRLFEDPADPTPERPMDFVLELKELEAADFISPSPVDGRFDGKLTLSGSLTAPEAALVLSAENVSVKGNRVGDVSADLKYALGTLYLRQMAVANKKSTFELSGTAALLDPKDLKTLEDPRFEIAFESPGIYLENIAPEFKGSITTHGNITGSLNHPRGEMELAGHRIDLGLQAFEKVLLSVTMDGSRFNIKQLKAVLQGQDVIQGTGWVSTDKGFALDLSSDGILLEKVAKGSLGETISGKLRFAISGGGTLDQPQLKGTLSTINLHLNGKAVDDADLFVNLADDRLKVTGKLNFDVDGTLDLKKKDFTLAARFDNTELMPYFKAAGQPDLSGTITGVIRGEGNLAAVDRINADAEFENLRIDYGQRNVVTASDFRFSFAQNTLKIPRVRLDLPGESHVDVSGTGGLEGPLDFELDGSIPLSALNLLTDEVANPKGRVLVKGRVKGTVQAPDVSGDVRIEDGGLTIDALEQKIDDIQADISITAGEIVLEQLTGRIGSGDFRLTGRLGLDRFQPTAGKLTLDATALPIEIPETLDLLLSSHIEVSGTPQSALAKGDVVLLEGTYYKDVNLGLVAGIQGLAAKKRQVAIKAESAQIPFIEQVKLNIAVKKRHPLIVDNNLANMEVHPDFRLVGTLKDPVLTGRATIEAGTVTYINSVFDIEKGVIDFNNPYRIEPEFDIESQAEVRDWLITMTISGTPEALDLKLKSDPPLGDADIASLLLFGRTSQEISAGGGSGSGQSSSNMLAELLASTYAKDIKDMTGLDVFEVRAGTDSSTNEEHITVTVGKEISERMTLKYATDSKKGEFIHRAIAEYKVLEHLLLSGFQDTSGSFGGAVKYRLEFR